MITRTAVAERAAGMIIGTALFTIGLVFAALGVTLLPVAGILIGWPVLWLAVICFRPVKRDSFQAESCRNPDIQPDAPVEESLAA